jgi:hypothetical protein
MDPVPDPRTLASEELKSLIGELVTREQDVSNTRRTLHVQIDALRRELVDRLRSESEGEEIIFGPDILGPGAAGVREPRTPQPQQGADGVALPEPSESAPDRDAPRRQDLHDG